MQSCIMTRKIRLQLGMSQRQLAVVLNTTQTSIFCYEKDRILPVRHAKNLIKLTGYRYKLEDFYHELE